MHFLFPDLSLSVLFRFFYHLLGRKLPIEIFGSLIVKTQCLLLDNITMKCSGVSAIYV